MALVLSVYERSIELAPEGGFASLGERGVAARERRRGAGAPLRSSQSIRLDQVQTFASTLLTLIRPPGPCFQAYQLPFCEMMQ